MIDMGLVVCISTRHSAVIDSAMVHIWLLIINRSAMHLCIRQRVKHRTVKRIANQ